MAKWAKEKAKWARGDGNVRLRRRKYEEEEKEIWGVKNRRLCAAQLMVKNFQKKKPSGQCVWCILPINGLVSVRKILSTGTSCGVAVWRPLGGRLITTIIDCYFHHFFPSFAKLSFSFNFNFSWVSLSVSDPPGIVVKTEQAWMQSAITSSLVKKNQVKITKCFLFYKWVEAQLFLAFWHLSIFRLFLIFCGNEPQSS